MLPNTFINCMFLGREWPVVAVKKIYKLNTVISWSLWVNKDLSLNCTLEVAQPIRASDVRKLKCSAYNKSDCQQVWLVAWLVRQWHDVCIGFGWETTQSPIIPVWRVITGEPGAATEAYRHDYNSLLPQIVSPVASSGLSRLQQSHLTSHLFIEEQQLTYQCSVHHLTQCSVVWRTLPSHQTVCPAVRCLEL